MLDSVRYIGLPVCVHICKQALREPKKKRMKHEEREAREAITQVETRFWHRYGVIESYQKLHLQRKFAFLQLGLSGDLPVLNTAQR